METRIKRNIIILIVATFLVIIGMCAGWFFSLVRPQREQIAQVQNDYTKYSDAASKLEANLKDKQKAEDQLEYLQSQIELFRGGQTQRNAVGMYRRLYFGDVAGESDANKADRDLAWRAWMNEYHYQFGPTLMAELQSAADAAKVALTMPAIKVDDPPQVPEDVVKRLPNNGFLKPLSATNNGTLTLQVNGEFNNLLHFLNLINHSSILMTVGAIKLEGYTPNIKATFPITPYLVASGPGTKLASSGASAGGAETTPGAGTPGAPGAGTPPATGATPPATASSGSLAPDFKIKNPRRQAELNRPAL